MWYGFYIQPFQGRSGGITASPSDVFVSLQEMEFVLVRIQTMEAGNLLIST